MDDFLVLRYNNYLAPFKQRLEEIKKFTLGKAKTKEKKTIAYNNAKKLYSILLSIYYNDYNDMTDEEKEKMDEKYNPNDLLIKGQRFIDSNIEDEEKIKSQPEETITERVKLGIQKTDDLLVTSQPSADKNNDDSDEFIDILDIPPFEGDERVKEGKELKILTQLRTNY